MITNYKKVKEDVLQVYSDFLPVSDKVKQGKATTYDSSLEALAIQAEDIKNDKFLLMIVGEAKSGKSTFINAYLGKEILPMDVKQCTSAIVEIRYGEKFILKATYADDRVQTFEDEQEIKNFLTLNAALDDNYRDIPVPTININVLVNYKGRTPPETIIKDLLAGIQNENIHHLPPEQYEAKVRQYIKEKQAVWQDIVKKIEIEYPFEDEDMRGIEIVDSPGVNAEGLVGEITNDYIVHANAVMFLKPITGAALEASSFKKFLNTASADRNKNAMFLILTRAANENQDNITRLHEEALLQFPDIQAEQIICVDSKVEMFANKIKDYSAEELQAYIDSLIDSDKFDSFLETPWYRARFDKSVYLKKLKELSNFAVVDTALNKFAHKAQYLMLSEFLKRLLDVLDKMQKKLAKDREYYSEKAENPEELAIKLRNTKDRLDDLLLALNEKVDAIGDKYTLPDGEIEQRAKKVVADYRARIDKINPSDSSSVEELEKFSFRTIDSFVSFKEELRKNIIAECDEALITLSDKDEIPCPETFKPDVTKKAIEDAKAQTYEEESGKTEEYTTGLTFKETHTRSAFSQSRYFEKVKSNIDGKIESIHQKAVKDLRKYVVSVAHAYSKELSKNIGITKDELSEIAKAKNDAEAIQVILKNIDAILEEIAPMITHIKALKGGIDKNV